MMLKKSVIVRSTAAVLCSIIFAPAAIMAAPPAKVTNGADGGPGSLRDALKSGATSVVIHPSVSTIMVDGTLYYNGAEPLKIVGSGATVEGYGDYTLLEITQGANLTISNLNFDGGGGFDVENQGGGKGIFVDVPEERVGTVRLKLTNVTVSGVGYHGVHVSDCTLEDACGSGGGGGGDGSPASVHAILKNVTIENVGYGAFDADGVRVDDRGDGDIIFQAIGSSFLGVGADGVELDEGDDGSVIIAVRNSTFELNGGYCDPIDPVSPPYADPKCVEDDDGELVLDLDDGFDIDEAGEGSLLGSVKNTIVTENLDEGLDFDEEGEGDINIDLVDIEASSNGDEGIKVSEEDDGDVLAHLRAVTAVDNGDDGIQIEQENGGEIHVTVNGAVARDNKASKYDLKVEQAEDDGEGGTLKVRGSDIDKIKAKNVAEI